MSCAIGHKLGSDLALPWLWLSLAAVSWDLTPILGTSICHGCGPKKTEKKKNTTLSYVINIKVIVEVLGETRESSV